MQRQAEEVTIDGKNRKIRASFKEWVPAILPAWIAGLVAGILFYITSAPTITWIHESQDSGELAACAATFGISHPTGYPLYTILGWIFIHLFSWIDPGRAMVIFSVICSAVAVGIIARAGAFAIQLIWKNESRVTAGWWGAMAAGFAAINPVVWSQAVVCEVYSLALLLQALVWLCIVKYLINKNQDTLNGNGKSLICLGLVLGLILSHHIAGAMIIIPVLIIFINNRPDKPLVIFRNSIIAMLPGLALYLYLPIRSMQNPRLDWGNPENWNNFIAHITASQYQSNVFGTSWDEFLRRVLSFRWGDHFGTLAIVLLIAGVIVLMMSRKGSRGKSFAAVIIIYMLWTFAFAIGYKVTDYEIFLYPLVPMVSILIAAGLAWIGMRLGRVSGILAWIFAAFVIVIMVMSGGNRYVDMDVSDPVRNSAATFAYRELSGLPGNAIVIVSSDGHLGALTYGATCGIADPVSGDVLPVRNGIDILASNWVLRDWFKQNVQNRDEHMERMVFESGNRGLQPALEDFVNQNILFRPVYIDSGVRQILGDREWGYAKIEGGVLLEIVRK